MVAMGPLLVIDWYAGGAASDDRRSTSIATNAADSEAMSRTTRNDNMHATPCACRRPPPLVDHRRAHRKMVRFGGIGTR
jgi:hypothetical protein